jgi:PAS domain S-box-containing protein
MMIQVIDGEGAVESASQATAELLGYAPEEIVGRQALSLFTEAVAPRGRREGAAAVLRLGPACRRGGATRGEGRRHGSICA